MGRGQEGPHRKPLIGPLSGDTIQYGKRASELQSGITIDKDRILHGTLHYVKGYEEFNPSNVAEQSGNYIAMQLPDTETCEITSASGTKSLPKDDRQLVWRVKDQDATLRVKTEEREETYSASGLTLESDPAAAAAILNAGARLDIQPGKDTTPTADTSEGLSEGPVTATRVVSIGDLAFLDGIGLEDGHMVEADLMGLTKAQLQTAASKLGMETSSSMTKAELAAKLAAVTIERLE